MFGHIFTIHFHNFMVENNKFYRRKNYIKFGASAPKSIISANAPNGAAIGLKVVVGVTVVQVLAPSVETIA